MFKKIHNWYLSVLVAVVSIFSLVLIQQYVTAQGWTDPSDLPGGTPANNLVVNPMLEDLQLGGHDLADTKLRIDGNGQKVIQVAAGSEICFNGTTDCASTWPNDGLWTESAPNIYYNTGNVGIGTASPTRKLSLFDNTTGPIVSLSGSTSNYRGVSLRQSSNDAENWFMGANSSNNFVLRRNELSDYFIIDNVSGNVGIGEPPHSGYRLSVGNGSSAVLKINPGEIWAYQTSLRLRSTSNVWTDQKFGIGTASPDVSLDVRDATLPSGTNSLVQIFSWANGLYGSVADSDDQNGGPIDFRFGATENYALMTRGFTIREETAGANRFFIAATTGNVGIGLTNPSYKLDVGGSVHGTSYYSSDGTAGVSTTINVRRADDTGTCTITVKNGLITATTCP